jgi:hypothetical protein
MKKLVLFVCLITPIFITGSLHAVTYLIPDNEPAYLKDDAVMKVGAKLYLFHSGTDEVKSTIHSNDVLTVYREYPSDFSLESREVGKVKVISPLGDYYFDGEVIKGEVKAGDLAKKGSIACFITSFKKNGHQLSRLLVN